MIPKDCKRLIEVDFPVAAVSAHSAREKSIRHGHPSTLHLWWARRPLAACRAVLLGLLLPDPCDEHCPKDFKTKARKLLPFKVGPEDMALRKALLRFIADFANWDMASNPTFLEAGRGLVKAAHPAETPLVVDPFAGGGSIPLEALRLGCEAFASDLNPVACLILKVMLEDIPKHGPKLAEELRKVGAEIKAKAEKELVEFYPKDRDGSTPIAYLWARTVHCEASDCGAEIPLVRSFWLGNKARSKHALRYRVVRGRNGPPRVEFEIFVPKAEKDVPSCSVARAKAKCLCCGQVLHPDRVRMQLSAQHGGADVIFDKEGNRKGGARLLAVVTADRRTQGRSYRVPTGRDYAAVWRATTCAKGLTCDKNQSGLGVIPDEPLTRVPVPFGVINVWVYGMNRWSDLFSARQKAAIHVLSSAVQRPELGKSERTVLAMSLGKLLRHCNVVSKWHRGSETVAGTFGLNAIPMSWDFPEMHPLASYAGGLDDAMSDATEPCESVARAISSAAQVQRADARHSPLSDGSCGVWFTDPPYYDSIPYSYLSDFFYIWLRRNIGRDIPELFRWTLTDKRDEIVAYVGADRNVDAARREFEDRMAAAFEEAGRLLQPGGVGCVVFAHKTTEGWEALIAGLIRAGLMLTASWPVSTERGARLRAKDAAALLASVNLVCRPRPKHSGVGDWGEVYAEMQTRVKDWMARLREEKIRGADAIFSCIGPALESYSRHEKVETAAGKVVPLGGNPEADEPHKRGFLAYVFEAVSKEALRQVLGDAETAGFEEDARLTALFLWTLQSTKVNGQATLLDSDAANDDEPEDEDEEKSAKAMGGFTMPFDTFIRIARPMGIHYGGWEKRTIEIRLIAGLCG